MPGPKGRLESVQKVLPGRITGSQDHRHENPDTEQAGRAQPSTSSSVRCSWLRLWRHRIRLFGGLCWDH